MIRKKTIYKLLRKMYGHSRLHYSGRNRVWYVDNAIHDKYVRNGYYQSAYKCDVRTYYLLARRLGIVYPSNYLLRCGA